MPSNVHRIKTKGREAWVARIQRNGRQITRTFYVSTWGARSARVMARAAAVELSIKNPKEGRDPRKRTRRNTTGRAGVYQSSATWGGEKWPFYGVTYTERGQRKTRRFYWHLFAQPLDRDDVAKVKRAMRAASTFRAECERAGMLG